MTYFALALPFAEYAISQNIIEMKDLSRHLKEAIEINTARLPLYAKLSQNRTIPFSKKLIWYEKLALLSSWYFDRIGDRYQAQGLPYLKLEFVEMSLIGAFSSVFPEGINFEQALHVIDIKPFSQNLKKKIKARDSEGIVADCNEMLEEMEKQKHVYCMLRHMVESIRRIAFLVPMHEERAAVLNIEAPTSYSFFLLKTHRWILSESKKLDEAIAPIQQSGIPFLFQDLPHIDLEVDY